MSSPRDIIKQIGQTPELRAKLRAHAESVGTGLVWKVKGLREADSKTCEVLEEIRSRAPGAIMAWVSETGDRGAQLLGFLDDPSTIPDEPKAKTEEVEERDEVICLLAEATSHRKEIQKAIQRIVEEQVEYHRLKSRDGVASVIGRSFSTIMSGNFRDQRGKGELTKEALRGYLGNAIGNLAASSQKEKSSAQKCAEEAIKRVVKARLTGPSFTIVCAYADFTDCDLEEVVRALKTGELKVELADGSRRRPNGDNNGDDAPYGVATDDEIATHAKAAKPATVADGATITG